MERVRNEDHTWIIPVLAIHKLAQIKKGPFGPFQDSAKTRYLNE